VTDDTTLQAMIYETRQDVRWIKEALSEIKKANQKQDGRIVDIETTIARRSGRDGALAAIVSAVVAFVVAFVSGGWLR
jgi:septal ring factor EnvC (AmiA/AmiB activator)